MTELKRAIETAKGYLAGFWAAWFVRQKHRTAVTMLINAAEVLENRCVGLQVEIDANKRRYEQIPEWKRRVEQAEKQAVEARKARAGLEKRVTALEHDLAALDEGAEDNAGRLREAEQTERHLRGLLKQQTEARQKAEKEAAEARQEAGAWRAGKEAAEREWGEMYARAEKAENSAREAAEIADKAKLRLQEVISQRDAYAEHLSAVVLYSKQIQVIIDKALHAAVDEPVCEEDDAKIRRVYEEAMDEPGFTVRRPEGV